MQTHDSLDQSIYNPDPTELLRQVREERCATFLPVLVTAKFAREKAQWIWGVMKWGGKGSRGVIGGLSEAQANERARELNRPGRPSGRHSWN